jgi:hypothetical protein
MSKGKWKAKTVPNCVIDMEAVPKYARDNLNRCHGMLVEDILEGDRQLQEAITLTDGEFRREVKLGWEGM